MNNEEKQFVSELYDKMLSGYFDLDDFKKAFNIISGQPEYSANVVRMRRTISSYVNMENLKELDKSSKDNTNNTTELSFFEPTGIDITNTDKTTTSLNTTDAIQITNPTHKEDTISPYNILDSVDIKPDGDIDNVPNTPSDISVELTPKIDKRSKQYRDSINRKR